MARMLRTRPGTAATVRPEVMTIDDLALQLQLSQSSLNKLVRKGTIPGHQEGRHWRLKRDTIDRWLDQGWLAGPKETT